MNEKMIKFSIIIERVWFAFIFIFTALSIWKLSTEGWPKAGIFFIFPVVAFVMFLLRRRTRLKLQKDFEEQKKNQG